MKPLDARQRAAERNRAERWFRDLTPGQKWELGDALVLGDFDPMDWGFDAKPSSVFLNALDRERQLWEQSLA